MLYRDYSRKEGEWIPNVFGGRENLEAMSFLRRLNHEVYGAFPGVQMYAEESTAWPMVSRPTYLGGLGFGMKWDMGWMHDTLKYLRKDPVHRRYHQNEITFRMLYAFSENFVLPLSHDEVVHGKGALLRQMPGDIWRKFASLRQLYSYMYAQPGKKLLFMGGEFGQWDEWDHNHSLQWHLLEHESHRGIARLIGDLNRIYRDEPALHTGDCASEGFEWVDCNDEHLSVIAFLRKTVPGAGGGASAGERVSGGGAVLVVCNFTPVPREDYHVGVPASGRWSEILNSDAQIYGGSGVGNLGGVQSTGQPHHGRPDSLRITLPPLGVLFFRHGDAAAGRGEGGT
jgi:1,4-alpha-glucan branching enzyme